VFGISIGIALSLGAAIFYVARRQWHDTPLINVTPAIGNLNSLGKNESPLVIANRGKSNARDVVVSMRIRNTLFEFDEIPALAPAAELPLTWNERAGRFKLEEIGIGANWLRTAVRSAVLDARSELRIPLSIHYRDDGGTERTSFQVLHCDQQLRIRVTES